MSFDAIVCYEYLKDRIGHMFSVIAEVINNEIHIISNSDINDKYKNSYILYSDRNSEFNEKQIFQAKIKTNDRDSSDRHPFVLEKIDKSLEFFKIIESKDDISENINLLMPFKKSNIFIKNLSENVLVGPYQIILEGIHTKAIPKTLKNGFILESYNYSEVSSNNSYYFKYKGDEYFCPRCFNSYDYIISNEKFLDIILEKVLDDNQSRRDVISIIDREIKAYSVLNIFYEKSLLKILKKLEHNNKLRNIVMKFSNEYLEKNNTIKNLEKELDKLRDAVKDKKNLIYNLNNEINDYEEKKNKVKDKTFELEILNKDLSLIKNQIDALNLQKEKIEDIYLKNKQKIESWNDLFHKISIFKPNKSIMSIKNSFLYFNDTIFIENIRKDFSEHSKGFFIINGDASWLTSEIFFSSSGYLNGVDVPISLKELFFFAEENPLLVIQIIILSANRAPIENYLSPLIKSKKLNIPLVFNNELITLHKNIIFFIQLDEDKYSATISEEIKKDILLIDELTLKDIFKEVK